MAPIITFKRVDAGEPATYRVIDVGDRPDGELLGTVTRFVRRYNLRRMYVSRGWRAVAADGTKLYGEGMTATLRRDAAACLRDYHDGLISPDEGGRAWWLS